jgi:periplasmic protein TonB
LTRGGVIMSIGIHVAVVSAALAVKADKKPHRAVSVAVVNDAKKKAPPKPPPPPPPPPPKVHHVAHHAAPPPAPEPAHTETAPAPAPVATGLEMSNTGPGIDVGGETRPADTHHQAAPEPVHKAQAVHRHPTEPDHTQGDGPAPCTEDPVKPHPIAKTEIGYTDEARASGVEGRLKLKITIDENGAVTKVEVEESVDPGLDAAAIAAVKQWRFKPSTRCGKPIAGTYVIARRFELGD